jgi:hypothetical protein
MDTKTRDAVRDMVLCCTAFDNQKEQIIIRLVALGYTRQEAEAQIDEINARKPQTAELKQRSFTTRELREAVYIVLAPPLDTPAKVKHAADLQDIPKVTYSATDGSFDMVKLCQVGIKGELSIQDWILDQGLDLRPMFITVSKTVKDFKEL